MGSILNYRLFFKMCDYVQYIRSISFAVCDLKNSKKKRYYLEVEGFVNLRYNRR